MTPLRCCVGLASERRLPKRERIASREKAAAPRAAFSEQRAGGPRGDRREGGRDPCWERGAFASYLRERALLPVALGEHGSRARRGALSSTRDRPRGSADWQRAHQCRLERHVRGTERQGSRQGPGFPPPVRDDRCGAGRTAKGDVTGRVFEANLKRIGCDRAESPSLQRNTAPRTRSGVTIKTFSSACASRRASIAGESRRARQLRRDAPGCRLLHTSLSRPKRARRHRGAVAAVDTQPNNDA